MKRKIIFSGCSFTWGQSLWSYENIPDIPNAYEWTQKGKIISEEIQNTRIKYRYPNLVCNSLGNYEPVVKKLNGGSDEESVYFIKMLMNNIKFDDGLYDEEVDSELVDAIVFQTTQEYRSSYHFEYKGKQYKLYSEPNMENISRVDEWQWNEKYLHYNPIPSKIDRFVDYCIDNNISPEDFAKQHRKIWITEIKNILKEFKDKGKKVFLLCWTDEYLEEIKKDKFLKSIFVPLKYDDKSFDCINDLYDYNEEMRIDNHIKNRDMGFDEHPSSICHEVIAESLIQKWNEKKV